MKIAIGCSMKYRSLAQDVVLRLNEFGFEPLFPNLDHTDDNEDKANTLEEKKRFALEHYEAINDADVVYY